MRNLKKILALALALVMTLSLMTVANAFNDDSQIDAKYDEAVTVLSNLKVFKGVNDGSNFAPKQTITRAEVAAIIYRIVTGDVNDTQAGIYKDYAKFKDVAQNHWAAGYIGYCSNAELIVGDGTNFYPDQTVNGYQALAMILRAMGYDANDEFKGEGWEIRVASTAQQRNLLVNINAGTLGTGASREMVAEILFQAITKNTVVYTPALGYYTSDLINGIATESLGYKTFGLQKNEGEISAVGRTAGTTTLGSWKTGFFGRNSFSDDVTVTNTNTAWTDIGYQAYVWTVPTSGAKTRTAVSDVVVTGESLLTSTDGTAHAVLTAATNGKVTVDSDYNVYLNGVRQTTVASRTAALNKAADRGVKIDYIDNDNGGRAEAIVVTEYTVARVSAINTATTTTGSQGVSESITYLADGIGSRESVAESKLVTSDTLAVGDWVTYVEYANDYYITEAPVTTAVFTSRTVSANADTVYTIGDSNYYISDLEYITGSTTVNAASSYLDGIRNRRTSVSIYTDPYGYIVYAEEYVAPSSYLYVLSNEHTNANTDLTEAVVALADGTITTVQIADESIWGQNNLCGMWSYSTNAAGYYVLGYQQTQMTNGTYTTNTATFTGNVVGYGTVNVAVDTATTVVDLRSYRTGDTNAAVYTGYTQIPTVQNATLWYADSINGAWTGSTMTVAFLLNNVNDVLKDFIVYQTTDYTEIVNQRTGQIVGYTMDVVMNGAVVANYELTPAEFAAIQQYGVGLYKFQYRNNVRVNDDIFTAFNEVDGVTASWNAGRISVTYDNAPFGGSNGTVNYTYTSDNQITVLNIGTGVNNFDLVYGRNYSVYVVANGTAAQYIYVIVDTEDVANSRAETLEKGGYTYTYTVSKSALGDDRTVCTGRVAIPTETWEEQALALVDGTGPSSYTLKDGVTLEQAEALRDAAQAVVDDENSTQAEAADAQKAVNILTVAINAYEAGQTTLGAAKTTALAALAGTYNALTKAEAMAAATAYRTAMANINAATTVDGVNSALAAGVAAVQAYDANQQTLNGLAAALDKANVPMDEMVAVLLKEETDVSKIGAALWSADNSNNGDGVVIPALIANDVSVETVYTDYLAAGKTVTDVTNALQNSTATEKQIVDGYAAYVLENKSIAGLSVTVEDGVYNVVVSSTPTISGTGIGDMLTALLGGANVTYTTQKTGDSTVWTNTKSVDDTKADVVNMIQQVINNDATWTMVVTLGSDTITVVFAPEA